MLDGRLSSAAELVRQGAVFADIGTDHAYLPIFLLESGRIERAVCADINPGPLASAERNIAEHGLSDRVELVLTDGVKGLGGKGITDYAVCGMGGEMIADIVTSAPQLREPGVRLILQPMTRQEKLREYLYREGFSILAEEYSSAEGKHYVTLLAEYCGTPREISSIEAQLGAQETVADKNDAYFGFLRTKLSAVRRRIEGRRLGGESVECESEIEMEIIKRLEGECKNDC